MLKCIRTKVISGKVVVPVEIPSEISTHVRLKRLAVFKVHVEYLEWLFLEKAYNFHF